MGTIIIYNIIMSELSPATLFYKIKELLDMTYENNLNQINKSNVYKIKKIICIII